MIENLDLVIGIWFLTKYRINCLIENVLFLFLGDRLTLVNAVLTVVLLYILLLTKYLLGLRKDWILLYVIFFGMGLSIIEKIALVA
jgi:hypothetical protein